MALSKEAQKIKSEYNKKYMERYWERKAEKRKNDTKAVSEKTKTVTTKRRIKTVSTVTVKETELLDWLLPEPHVTEVTVSRNGQSDAQYIGIADIISVLTGLIDWVRAADLEKAKEITRLADAYIKDKL